MSSRNLVESAIEKKKREQELRRVCLLTAAALALDKLALIISFDKAYIFGSVAKPYCFNELSDLDIGFYGLKDQDFFVAMAFLSRETGLDNVDILQLEEHRLANKILKEGIPWKKSG